MNCLSLGVALAISLAKSFDSRSACDLPRQLVSWHCGLRYVWVTCDLSKRDWEISSVQRKFWRYLFCVIPRKQPYNFRFAWSINNDTLLLDTYRWNVLHAATVCITAEYLGRKAVLNHAKCQTWSPLKVVPHGVWQKPLSCETASFYCVLRVPLYWQCPRTFRCTVFT